MLRLKFTGGQDRTDGDMMNLDNAFSFVQFDAGSRGSGRTKMLDNQIFISLMKVGMQRILV